MTYSAVQLQVTQVLQQFLRRVNGKVLTATGGSVSAIIDTKLAEELGDNNEDDIYNGGTAIVVKDAAGLNAAPEGEFSRITDYVAGTTTLTLSPSLTTAVASGDKVLVVPSEFPLYDMVEVLNDALHNLGDIPAINTSLTTTDNTTEYALPVALKGTQLLNVEVDDDGYSEVPNWRVVPSAPGSTALLVIPQYPAGRTLRLTYYGIHPRVEAFDDPISEYLHPELVHAAMFVHALQWRNDNDAVAGGADQSKLALEQKAWNQYDRARLTHPIDMPKRRQQGFVHWTIP